MFSSINEWLLNDQVVTDKPAILNYESLSATQDAIFAVCYVTFRYLCEDICVPGFFSPGHNICSDRKSFCGVA